jgi:hypothetical protein
MTPARLAFVAVVAFGVPVLGVACGGLNPTPPDPHADPWDPPDPFVITEPIVADGGELDASGDAP